MNIDAYIKTDLKVTVEFKFSLATTAAYSVDFDLKVWVCDL